MSELTEEDYNNLSYFHKYTGDITRWVNWEDKLPLFKEKHPELIDAIRRVKSAKITLNIIVDKLSGD